MKFKGKDVQVIITGCAKEEFLRLSKIAEEEVLKGMTKSENQTLLNSIKQKIELLKENPEYGTHIPKNRIPKHYVIAYEVNNLWKVDLSLAWRMIYTIRGSKVEIISLIMDLMSHKDYEKMFGY
jgi:hypothetical protein